MQPSQLKFDKILPYTIKKVLARLDKYFGRFEHFCVMTLKTFDHKYQREFRRLARECSRHKIACRSYIMRDLYGYACVCNNWFIQRVYLCARAQTHYFQETAFDNALKTEMKTVKFD